MTWVAPYAVAASKARLQEIFQGLGMKEGLTHLALQFFEPTMQGGVRRSRNGDDLSDARIIELRDWAHGNGIRVMLCVYNGGSSWDWPLARAAFANHPKEFAANLLLEVERLNLDGVDVDLEGNGELDADKKVYVDFIRELSNRLHEKKRQLTVDSFAHIWNAPNQSWWKELLPLVDGLNTMGYNLISSAGKDWSGYAAQEAACGQYAAKLLIGMPSDVGQWRDLDATEHLRWMRDHGQSGVSIWDAQMEAPAWRSRDTWIILKQIRGTQ